MLCLPLLLHSLVHPSNIAGKLWIRANWVRETNMSIADTQLFLLHFQSFRFDHTPQQSNSLPDDKWQPAVDRSSWSSEEHWTGDVLQRWVTQHPWEIIIITGKYTCPLHSIREIVFVLWSCLGWKVQFDQETLMKWTLSGHLSTHVKKSRAVTVVDTRLQHDFQLCCDPAYLRNQNLRWIILEHRAPKLPPSYKDEKILKTFRSWPTKYFRIRIIFTEKNQ